jgi:hypothetical protein
VAGGKDSELHLLAVVKLILKIETNLLRLHARRMTHLSTGACKEGTRAVCQSKGQAKRITKKLPEQSE